MFKESLAAERGSVRWKGKEYSFTTGQFAKLDHVYKRHCGPTAITNLVYALAAADGKAITEKPENVFRKVAGIGGRRLIYLNAEFLRVFGGTSDLLVPVMIRRCLKEYGIRGYKVSGPFPATSGRICRELDRGAILYLEVHRHPVYGNHHMLCYGYSVKNGRLMIRTADGWIGKIHDLPAGEELFALCTVIRKKKRLKSPEQSV